MSVWWHFWKIHYTGWHRIQMIAVLSFNGDQDFFIRYIRLCGVQHPTWPSVSSFIWYVNLVCWMCESALHFSIPFHVLDYYYHYTTMTSTTFSFYFLLPLTLPPPPHILSFQESDECFAITSIIFVCRL